MRLLISILLLAALVACSDNFEKSNADERWTIVEGQPAQPQDCPDPDDPLITYAGHDRDECNEIQFAATGSSSCPPGQEYLFNDECGCGCIVSEPEPCEIDGCRDGYYCHYNDGVCGDNVSPGVCTPIPDNCTDDVAEVCGCDGQFHRGSSDCAAPLAGVDSHRDEQFCDSGPACVDEDTGQIDPGACFIFDECVAQGTTNPVDDCQICDPSRSQLDWVDIRGCAPQVDAGRFHSCAVGAQNQIVCWPEDNQPGGRASPPDNTFWQTTVGHFHSCGINTSDQLQCWGSAHDELNLSPAGTYWDVSASRWYSCAVDADQQLECWGRDDLSYGQSNPPSGSFVAVSTAPRNACAIRDNGTLLCWGRDANMGGLPDPPEGKFAAVSVNFRHACALTTNGEIQCWGSNAFGQSNPPAGNFRQVSAGRHHSCALDNSGTIQCWGRDQHGETDPPSGRFRAVSSGAGFSCGFDMSNQIHCWGDEGRIDAPLLDNP